MRRLFRSKSNDLLEQHLVRVGVDQIWWPQARVAISNCEARRWFEPVLSAAGPIASRTVVAAMALEPFVRGGVDWDAHPNPFLDNPVFRDLYEETLEETRTRWLELYGGEEWKTDLDVGSALAKIVDV